jgi:hypothetical protein
LAAGILFTGVFTVYILGIGQCQGKVTCAFPAKEQLRMGNVPIAHSVGQRVFCIL